MQGCAKWPMMPTMLHLRHTRFLLAVVLAAAVSLPAGTFAAEDESVLDERLLDEAIEILQERYVHDDALTRERLTVGAIRGIVDALGDDGHTQYLTAEEYEVEQEVLQGRVAGIGVVLDGRSAAPLIIAVVDGSPADRAGLRAGDIIATVGGIETARLPRGELADHIRGEPGTVVNLGIERPGATERQSVPLVRQEVEIDPVSWAMAPGSDVAVIRVVQFSTGAGQQVREAVEDIATQGATGIVLDLRGNPGGLVAETLNAASAFLDGGVAFMERSRDEAPEPIKVAANRVVDVELPLVVLVDYGTASSGEILAAALRDNGRARVIGERTFGTGTILNTISLDDGSALRLGVREWLTPEGEAVFRIGLTPDEEVSLPLGAIRLDPGDLLGLTPVEFEDSDDVPLRRAVRLAASGG